MIRSSNGVNSTASPLEYGIIIVVLDMLGILNHLLTAIDNLNIFIPSFSFHLDYYINP
uniref:Uncharacterized protein n=1 Tax=Heterorhabditis bacteriophora TaxID=37862 RepID=A0A1I7WUV8_HETBA